MSPLDPDSLQWIVFVKLERVNHVGLLPSRNGVNSGNERVPDLKRREKKNGMEEISSCSLKPLCKTFFTLVVQAPNRTSASHRELGSGILGSFFNGRPFLGIQ